MSVRTLIVVSGLSLLALGSWIAEFAQPLETTHQDSQPKTKQPPGQKKNVQQGQPSNPVAIDVAAWPAENTVTVRLAFGIQDEQPLSWDGRVTATGASIVRLRPWRFGNSMTVDTGRFSWVCGSWLGPLPADRVFDRHLANMPQAFVRPGVLIDVAADSAPDARLEVATAQGAFSVDLARILRNGGERFLNDRVWVDVAVHGYPVAVRSQPEQRDWYDDPSLATSTMAGGEIAVSYLAYSQRDTSDSIRVRRRVNGTWQEPETVSDRTTDHYRSTVCYDAAGKLWVSYASQVQGNWDLYCRTLSDGKWQPVMRLTDDLQPDFQQVMVADPAGGLWVVWQGFRGGQSDILARYWNGREWEAEQRVSTSPTNDWSPSVTALSGRGIAVAWDSYDAGNYDIWCRVADGSTGTWNAPIRVTQSATLEARPTIAADRSGRLWIAFDSAGSNWGKDTGFQLELARAPQGTRLYDARSVQFAVVDPPSARVLALDDSSVHFSSFNRSLHEHVEYPQIIADGSGRMWLIMRRRAALSMSRRGIGRLFAWEVLVSRYDTTRGEWTEPQIATDSLGRLDALAGIGSDDSGIWLAWAHDHRTYSANRPDASSIFVGHLHAAGRPADDVALAQFKAVTPGSAPQPTPTHANEANDVARMRSAVTQVGAKHYRIFRGDMHRHTETSSDGGGDGSMLDVYRYALDAAAMDFLLVTDHHDGDREYDWWRREKFNDLFRVGESFTGLFGYERSLSYPNGHRNVFFTRRGVRPLANQPQEAGRDPVGSGRFLYPHLREFGGICFSHTSATGMGTDWRDNDPELEPLVEIFQGDRTNYEQLGAPWSADAANPGTQEGGFQPLGYVNRALAKGYKLGFQASSDHLSTHLSYSCILAERNTREALMDAMKQRHAYAATDNILLDVRSQGVKGEHCMGDILACAEQPKVRVRVVGTKILADVVLIKDERVVYSIQPDSSTASFEFTDLQAERGRESYYYVRVVQTDRQMAWSSPLWITRQ